VFAALCLIWGSTWLAATGVMTYSLDYGLIYWAEQYLSAGITSIFFASYVLFTALASRYVYRMESFRWWRTRLRRGNRRRGGAGWGYVKPRELEPPR